MVPQLTRRAALAGLSTLVALPVRAQTAPAGKPNPDAEEFAALAQPIVFDIRPNTGTLKETVQKGQDSSGAAKKAAAMINSRSATFLSHFSVVKPVAR